MPRHRFFFSFSSPASLMKRSEWRGRGAQKRRNHFEWFRSRFPSRLTHTAHGAETQPQIGGNSHFCAFYCVREQSFIVYVLIFLAPHPNRNNSSLLQTTFRAAKRGAMRNRTNTFFAVLHSATAKQFPNIERCLIRCEISQKTEHLFICRSLFNLHFFIFLPGLGYDIENVLFASVIAPGSFGKSAVVTFARNVCWVLISNAREVFCELN